VAAGAGPKETMDQLESWNESLQDFFSLEELSKHHHEIIVHGLN